jgi:hypothetical protein
VNHISLVNGVIGCTGVPEVRYTSSARGEARNPRASSRERASAQVITGVSGSNRPSRPISPCMAVLTAIATTVPLSVAVTHSVSASSTAVRMACGSWTCHPGSGASNGYSRIAVWRCAVPISKATALVAVVPTSRPMTSSPGGRVASVVVTAVPVGAA